VALTITNFFVTMIVSAVIVFLTTKISLLAGIHVGATVGGHHGGGYSVTRQLK